MADNDPLVPPDRTTAVPGAVPGWISADQSSPWAAAPATAVLDRPVTPPTGRSGRTRTAALLTAALLAGGVGGGAVATNWPRTATSTAAVPASVARSSGVVQGVSLAAGTTEAAAKTAGPSVVTIEVTGRTQSTFGRTQAQSDTGSGVVIRADGYVLTNNHVVSAAAGGGSVSVTFSDGRTVPATIVGTDATSDLAVLKVDAAASGLTAAVFADSDQLQVGQQVLAVGAPLGLSNTVTEGIVSTLHRPVATGEAGASAQSVIDAVQTDAAINPGNSGGALVDLAGRVVGINSAIAAVSSSASGGQSGNIGVGFAISANTAAKVADQLIATGHATHAQIGVSVTDSTAATTGAPGVGATLGQVSAGGPAAKAGLQSGDVVTKVDDRIVTDADSLIVAVRAHDPGTTVTVTYRRGDAVHTAQVQLTTG
jgi:putative serine protease PepD